MLAVCPLSCPLVDTVQQSFAACARFSWTRNRFASGTAQAFASDEKAASLSLEVISKGWDTVEAGHYAFSQRLFVYLPLMHSEKMEAQVRGGYFRNRG